MTTTTQGPGHPDRPRGGNGRFVRTPDSAERDAEACRLRAAGESYDRIAATLGYADKSNARKAVERALAATVAEPAAQLRTLELARLDAAQVKVWEVLRADHVVVSHGRVVHDEDGRPLKDHGPVLAAVDRAIKISERRCKLLGLDAPVRVEAITVDQIEAEINRLAAELAVNDNTEETSWPTTL